MKNTICLLMLAMVLGVCAQEWDFTKGSCGWLPTKSLTSKETPEGLELTFNGEYPNFLVEKLDFTTAQYDYLEIKYVAEGEIKNNGGIMFFGTKEAPTLNEEAKYYMPGIVFVVGDTMSKADMTPDLIHLKS